MIGLVKFLDPHFFFSDPIFWEFQTRSMVQDIYEDSLSKNQTRTAIFEVSSGIFTTFLTSEMNDNVFPRVS